MKKKLLKSPENDGEILFLPTLKEFLSCLKEKSRIGICHQPYFFHPGVSLKFLLLESLSKGEKEIIFLDTDKVKINVNVPLSPECIKTLEFINTDYVLSDYPTPEKSVFNRFLTALEDELSRTSLGDVISNFSIFKEIIFKNSNKKFLKEVLAESFLQFYNIKRNYYFLSDLVRSKEFEELFLRIYKKADYFREVFNTALDEYKKEFRFRYKNFPFPKLEEDELPFWIVKDGKRERCFKRDIDIADFSKLTIFPRAVTLTIFLRLYRVDFFVHGIGGANYEWVQDRIIERIFKQSPPSYAVISGTFLIENFKEREFPYFFFSPQRIKEKAQIFLKE